MLSLNLKRLVLSIQRIVLPEHSSLSTFYRLFGRYLFPITLLATSTLNAQTREESPSSVQQMLESMSHMEERLNRAEQRADRAEAQMLELERELHSQGIHSDTIKHDVLEKTRLADEAHQRTQENDFTQGTPDYNNNAIVADQEKPFASLGVNYFYGRTGWASNFKGGERFGNDGRNTGFVNPLISDNNAGRLGNELDTYLEPSFKVVTVPFSDSSTEFGAQVTFDTYTNQRHQIDLITNLVTLDFFGYAKHILPFSPDAEVWAGRRGYLYQFYVNMIDRRSAVIGGDGGGINNLALGEFAKFDIAYLTASPTGGPNESSINPLNPGDSTFGDIRTKQGNLNKQAVYFRFHDIATPIIGGQSSLHMQYSFAPGGRALSSGGYQGTPGNFTYNNLNYRNGVDFGYTDGISIGYVHELLFPKLSFAPTWAISNKLYLGAGWGNEYDTTNANKLRQSPFYQVPVGTQIEFGHMHPFGLGGAHSFKLADQINFSITPEFELESYLVYEHQNSGRPNIPIADPGLGTSSNLLPGYFLSSFNADGSPLYAHAVQSKGTQNWVDLGLRPAYNFTRWFALVGEGTFNFIHNSAYNAARQAASFYNGSYFKFGNGELFKFTLAPTLRYGTIGNYPVELRFYYTFAWWNDVLKGSSVAGDAYRDSNMGHLFGTQAVLNF